MPVLLLTSLQVLWSLLMCRTTCRDSSERMVFTDGGYAFAVLVPIDSEPVREKLPLSFHSSAYICIQ